MHRSKSLVLAAGLLVAGPAPAAVTPMTTPPNDTATARAAGDTGDPDGEAAFNEHFDQVGSTFLTPDADDYALPGGSWGLTWAFSERTRDSNPQPQPWQKMTFSATLRKPVTSKFTLSGHNIGHRIA